jgi:ATP-binding cassette subfamily B protein/subfamily B ATP-binding cassette protein MsbA
VLSRRESSRTRYDAYREKRRAEKPEAISHRLEEPSKKKRSRTFFELFRKFWSLTRGHRPAVGLALTTLTIVVGLRLIQPASTKLAFDYILAENPKPIPARWAQHLPHDRFQLLWLLGAAMITVALLSVIIGNIGRWQMTRVTKRLQVYVRKIAFDHAGALPLHRIHYYKSGGMSSLLREDAGSTADLLFNMIYNPWAAVVQLLGTLVVLGFVDWRMLAGSLLLIPALWITNKTWIARIRPMYRDTKLVRQVIDSTTTEAFGGMRVVRGFNREQAESVRFTTSQHYLARLEVLIWWWSRILEGIWSVLVPLASASVLIYGGYQVLQHRLTLGDLVMFMTYVIMLLSPIETLTSTATNIQTNLAALDRVLDLLGEEQEFGGKRTGKLVSRETAEGHIQLKDVWFTYPKPSKRALVESLAASNVSMNGEAAPSSVPDSTPSHDPQPVIRGISLNVQAGQTIALVGPSGSGKTTLCNLIARFYDPTRGTIFFDGTDLKDIDVRSYRSLLGIVEQDVFLFDGTIAENIAYARRDATEQQVIEAARAANAHEFIQQLDKGYNTMIGERGVRLSGGQKQRIAIARALLADPLILILDEATSNLDSESEGLIQRSLATLMQGRTAFVIAHRLSTVRSADLIVVLDKGEVIEQGTHEQLNARGGRYAELLRIQVEGHGVQRPGGTAVPAVSSAPPTSN